MNTCTNKIREISLQLLEKEAVVKVIGFANGTIPMATSPISITNKQDVEKLVFNSTCGLNLATYLKQSIKNKTDKIAVIAKGCDARNIITHIVENQIKREQLHIIGVPCHGMIDKSKIASLFDDEITEFSLKKLRKKWKFDKIIVEPIVKLEDCVYIVSGIVEFYKGDAWVATIDFGDGTCDEWATKYWDGGSKVFSMKK